MYLCVCMCAMNELKLLCPFQKKIPSRIPSSLHTSLLQKRISMTKIQI